ncbi:ABC transporter permease [Paradevosia shaoguanensis]|uniref:ABC transporter permease n=1 Tax=Paradevosia shaoguanensis TaxID=1335043 RepID=A0AA41UEU7_9HYPH|nr:ABC transporter permease [Paradevosia shaoguanensis]MCF1744366.1 ABC transporter permease [Paradevosia shaoguanensis]MCI0128849.1 ABC transporter permease [Paradevosia shaoguanensis]
MKIRLNLLIPTALLALVVLFALFGGFFTQHAYDVSNLLNRNKPPVFLGGSWTYPLGTDGLGRDSLARLVFAARVSVGLALVGTIAGAILGTTLGLIAARSRNMLGSLIDAAIDLQAAIPFMIIALATLAIFGNSLPLFVAILSIYGWESYARLVRGSAMSAHTLTFVDAARTIGVSPLAIDIRHILPTVFNVVIVQLTLNFPQTILLETGLSFLGLGIQPPFTSLGQLLGEGRDSLARAWWLAVVPGALIFVTTLSVSLLGDALRDRLDPTLRGR